MKRKALWNNAFSGEVAIATSPEFLNNATAKIQHFSQMLRTCKQIKSQLKNWDLK
jgi:hypothetical protein